MLISKRGKILFIVFIILISTISLSFALDSHHYSHHSTKLNESFLKELKEKRELLEIKATFPASIIDEQREFIEDGIVVYTNKELDELIIFYSCDNRQQWEQLNEFYQVNNLLPIYLVKSQSTIKGHCNYYIQARSGNEVIIDDNNGLYYKFSHLLERRSLNSIALPYDFEIKNSFNNIDGNYVTGNFDIEKNTEILWVTYEYPFVKLYLIDNLEDFEVEPTFNLLKEYQEYDGKNCRYLPTPNQLLDSDGNLILLKYNNFHLSELGTSYDCSCPQCANVTNCIDMCMAPGYARILNFSVHKLDIPTNNFENIWMSPHAQESMIISQGKFIDLDGDNISEIIYTYDPGILFINKWNGNSYEPICNIEFWPNITYSYIDYGFDVGDLLRDGSKEVILATGGSGEIFIVDIDSCNIKSEFTNKLEWLYNIKNIFIIDKNHFIAHSECNFYHLIGGGLCGADSFILFEVKNNYKIEPVFALISKNPELRLYMSDDIKITRKGVSFKNAESVSVSEKKELKRGKIIEEEFKLLIRNDIDGHPLIVNPTPMRLNVMKLNNIDLAPQDEMVKAVDVDSDNFDEVLVSCWFGSGFDFCSNNSKTTILGLKEEYKEEYKEPGIGLSTWLIKIVEWIKSVTSPGNSEFVKPIQVTDSK